MAISDSQSGDIEPTVVNRTAEPGSAIKKQQAAQLLKAEKTGPDLPIREQTQPETKKSKAPRLFVIALLMLLVVFFLFRYQHLLLSPSTQVVAGAEPLVEGVPLQRELDEARAMSRVLLEEPYKLAAVAKRYRQILVETPGQPEALLAMQQLPRQCLLLVSFYMASGQLDIARELVEDSLAYFPELADDPLWQQLIINIPESDVDVAITEGMVDGVLEEQGQEVVAATQTEAETEIETKADQPEPASLVAGVGSSAAQDLPLTETIEPIATEPIPEVSTSAATGVAPASDSLQSGQQDMIDTLLQEADDFNQKGIQFTQQENAVTRYQDVLALQPVQADATAGLKALIETRIAYVKRLLAENDLDTAELMLAPALRHFPDNLQLQALSSQLDSRVGVISSLEVDFLPVSAMDPTLVTVGGQTLLLNFSYKYFPTTTTVVNAQLFSLPGLDTIAGVPIILQDPRGSKSVQMNTLTRKVGDGRYQLILSSGDKQLIKYEFTVNNNTISNNGGL